MPLANLKLLVRPDPDGLEDHRKYVTGAAKEFLQNNQFADLVLTSEDGVSVECHQALVVSRSSLLRSICGCVPHQPGAVTRLQVAVPVSGPTLLTIQELLYTGQVSRTRPELVAVSQGLAALGIDNFSQLPTAAGVQQQTPGAGPAVAVQQFLGLTSGLGTAASPGTKAAAELLVHRLDPAKITVKIKRNEDGNNKAANKTNQDKAVNKINADETNDNTKQDMANNNVFKNDEKSEKDINRKRKRLSEGNLNPKTDEIELEGSPVTEEVAGGGGVRRPVMMRLPECEDCGQQLRSAWHRHPTRHRCVRREGEGEGGAGVRCPECGAALRSAWFLPPSRHACSATNPGKRRKRLSRDPKAASASKQEKLEQEAEDADGSADGFVTPCRSDAEEEGKEDTYFSCPLKQCSRKCETKKLLMLHLAMSHFFKKMEAKYISEEGVDGGHRKCAHCDVPQPLNKMGFIRHVAMEHGEVMEAMAAETIYGKREEVAV